MFKYYASQLNLSKPQLEAVTDCFKACFEADGSTGSEPYNKETQNNVDLGKKHVPFDDSGLPWSEEMKNIFELPSYMKNRKKLGTGSQLNKKTMQDFNKMAANVRDGDYQNNVYQIEKIQKENKAIEQQRQRVMHLQENLNKALGINLTVDGIMGPKTKAALKQYKDKKAAYQTNASNNSMEVENAARNTYAGTPMPPAEPAWANDVQAYHNAQSGQHRWKA